MLKVVDTQHPSSQNLRGREDQKAKRNTVYKKGKFYELKEPKKQKQNNNQINKINNKISTKE